jgi:hypothetical protein
MSVNRSRIRGRRIGGILATSLFILSTMPGMVTAANNRIVWFGSPDGSGGDYDNQGNLVFGALTNTAVTEGKKWATVLLVRNDNPSGSTLNHVKIAGGANADALRPTFNPLFRSPSGTSLPSGASFAKVIVLEGTATCDPDVGAGIACDVGTLAAGAFVKFLVVVNAPAKGTANWWLTGSWNEGWSSTGTNADYNFATGTVDVKESNCGNGQSSYFLGSEPVDLNDGSASGVICNGPNGQDAGITSGARLDTNGAFPNGGFAKVVIDSADITCPAIYKCFGKPVSVSILNSAPVPGGVVWTVTWYGTKTIKGVLHVSDGATPTFTPIYLTKSYKCSDTLLRDCWRSVTPSAGNAKPASVTVVFVTDSNGKGIGF